MRTGRKDGRQESDIHAGAARGDEFGKIVRRGGTKTQGHASRRSSVPAVRTPAYRIAGIAREDHDQATRLRDPSHLRESRLPPGRWRGVVSKDDAGPARQARERLFQRPIGAFVGHQP